MRQILSFVFVGLFAGCHGSENPVVSPDDAAGDAMASDSSANAAKMTVSAGTAGGGSNRQVPRSHKARELVSATTNAGGLTLSSGTAGGYTPKNYWWRPRFRKTGPSQRNTTTTFIRKQTTK